MPSSHAVRAIALGDFGDQLSEEAIVPSGAFELDAVGALVGVALDDVEGEAAQQREPRG